MTALYRPVGREVDDPRLDRLIPDDWEHVEKWPLGVMATTPTKVPAVLGINWYDNFDRPELHDGKYWIGRGNLGKIRGGHCVCCKPAHISDILAWYLFYDQGEEGACVGFGSSRAMTLLNRKRYQAFWLYKTAQRSDEWPGEDYEGTSVRAAMDVLRLQGHVPVKSREKLLPSANTVYLSPNRGEGISAVRWASTIDEVLSALGDPNLKGLPILNSWGGSYPRVVYMDLDAANTVLFNEDGEVAVPTDR